MKNNKSHDLKGEQKDQLLVVTDKKGKTIGTATREMCHSGNGKTHLAFMAFVIDPDNNVILTKRSSKKSLWAGFWDASVVSHILPNETVEQAARRRGKEELGIEVDFRKVGEFYYFAKQGKYCENEFCYVLIGKTGLGIHTNPVEIDLVKKFSLDELKNDIQLNPKIYTPWLKIAMIKTNLSSYI